MAGSALVLGGGGVTGVAWEIGVLAGLAERGVPLRDADLIVGTSAGSVVGAHLACGTSLRELYGSQLEPPGQDPVARLSVRATALILGATLRYRDPVRARARIGRMARAARTMPEAQRRAELAARLPAGEWPDRRLLITAVDAESGEFTAFEAGGGASLAGAVGASCAVPGVWPPVSIGGRRWMDGGMRSPANADLAAGHDRIVVLAPLPRGVRAASGVAAQADGLRRRGHQVVVVSPDRAALAAIGRNVLDPERRAPAARAGHHQAATEADRVAAVWKA